MPYFLTSLLHEAMHLFQRVEGNLPFFFYLFFPVEKKKDIILFWSLSFFQPHFICHKLWCTSLDILELPYIPSMKLTHKTHAPTMSIDPFLPTHNLHRHQRPPIKTIIVVHRQHLRHLPLRRRCLYCPRYFNNNRAMGQHGRWCRGHYQAWCRHNEMA